MKRKTQQTKPNKFQFTLEEIEPGDDLDFLMRREAENAKKKLEAKQKSIQRKEEKEAVNEAAKKEQEEKKPTKLHEIIDDNPLMYEELVSQFFMFLDVNTLLKIQLVCKLWYSLLGTSNHFAAKNSESLKLARAGMFDASKKRVKPTKKKKNGELDIDSEEETEQQSGENVQSENFEDLFDKLQLRQSSFWFTIFERDFGRHALYLAMTGAIHETKTRKKFKRRIQVGELNVLQYLKEVYMKFYGRKQELDVEIAKCPRYQRDILEVLQRSTTTREFLSFKSCMKHKLSPRHNHFVCIHCNSSFTMAIQYYFRLHVYTKRMVLTVTTSCDVLQLKLKFNVLPTQVTCDSPKLKELQQRKVVQENF